MSGGGAGPGPGPGGGGPGRALTAGLRRCMRTTVADMRRQLALTQQQLEAAEKDRESVSGRRRQGAEAAARAPRKRAVPPSLITRRYSGGERKKRTGLGKYHEADT